MRKLFLIMPAALGIAAAADLTDFSGKWLLDVEHSKIAADKPKAETLSIAQKEASIEMIDQITGMDGKEKTVEIKCNIMGKDCKTKDSQVSFYYNGPKLIMIETRHNNDIVIKKQLERSDDGKTLSMEVMHIAPPSAKNDMYTFNRQ